MSIKPSLCLYIDRLIKLFCLCGSSSSNSAFPVFITLQVAEQGTSSGGLSLLAFSSVEVLLSSVQGEVLRSAHAVVKYSYLNFPFVGLRGVSEL